MSVQIPAVPKVSGIDDLTTHLNDRLRRISAVLGAGAQGPRGAPGGTGSLVPVTGAPPFTVPVHGSTATPNASSQVNILTEIVDTFVATPTGIPAAGVAFWSLVIKLAAAGCSTQFASSYNFAITATGPDSPLGGTVTLNLATDFAGATTLISFSATT